MSQKEQTVFDVLRARSDAANWLSFETFLEIAQHHPIFGYYGSGQVKIGKGGDFYTAPEMTPIFGETIAQYVEPILLTTNGHLLELGAGQGAFAEAVLAYWESINASADRQYYIYEISPALRARQQQRLAGHPRVRWLDALPTDFSGVVFANEVLDSIPFRLYRFEDNCWLERGVKILQDDTLQWSDRPTRDDCHARLLGRELPYSYQTEISPAAEAFVHQLVSRIKHGVVLLGDYGYGRDEYYHPQRLHGTLCCYSEQKMDSDPLHSIGQKDITAHVDFTAVADAALEAGGTLRGYLSQTHFLFSIGITENMQAHHHRLSQVEYIALSSQFQKLVMPHEMGEVIKWMMISKGDATGDAIDNRYESVGVRDRRHTL